jgi:hypothetical protein
MSGGVVKDVKQVITILLDYFHVTDQMPKYRCINTFSFDLEVQHARADRHTAIGKFHFSEIPVLTNSPSVTC